ncbi:MAG: hypothetical protein MZV49_15985 [Rhodopseudomonas palustris]|nr:hypothetical protein [Rhodopseudomonas palustris]
MIDLYFADATGIKGKEKVLEILQAQLSRTETQLQELTAFKHDLTANIARMHALIDEAKRK